MHDPSDQPYNLICFYSESDPDLLAVSFQTTATRKQEGAAKIFVILILSQNATEYKL